jgi:hypothetical protein
MPQWLSDYIYGLSPAEFNFFTLVLFITVLFSLFKIYQTHHQYRFIQDTATSRIASAAQGYVELKGLAELLPGSNIKSPFSQRKCIWYQCRVEIKKTTGKRSHWVEESNQISEEIFLLRDDTGECIVIPEQAEVIPSHQRVWYGNDIQASKLAPKSSGFLGLSGIGNYRFTEKMIFVADPIYVLGDFESIRKNPDQQSIQQQVKELIQHWKIQPMRYLKPFDRDGNGKIQKNEWREIKRHAEFKAREQNQQTVIHTIRKPVEQNHPFLISTKLEAELLNKKRLSLILYVMLFFVMLIALITMITLPNK